MILKYSFALRTWVKCVSNFCFMAKQGSLKNEVTVCPDRSAEYVKQYLNNAISHPYMIAYPHLKHNLIQRKRVYLSVGLDTICTFCHNKGIIDSLFL